MAVLARVQHYLRRTGVPPTTFGRCAVNDPRLVGDLARGREPGPAMVARIEAYMAAHPRGRA